MTSPISAILFDFGGVLAEEGFRNGLIALASEQGIDVKSIPEQGMRAVYDSGFVLGKGTPADFWALLAHRTGLQGMKETLTQRILDGFVIRPRMMQLVRELRGRGYITGILSDQTLWLDLLDERYGFYKEFDHIFNSYYLGKGKQDPTLFADVAAYLDLSPAEILFIDDDSGNIERASVNGYQVLLYVNQQECLTELEKMLS
ncbi:HAD family hydrolase [Kaarinaea lacus]